MNILRNGGAAVALAHLLIASAASAASPVALTAASPAVKTPAAAVSDGPVEGFGSDLPLPIVLAAIIPTNVSVLIDGVSDATSLKTSWEGGPSWHKSLDDALRPLDLIANYGEPHRVTITTLHLPDPSRIGVAEAAAVQTTPPAPPLPQWQQPDVWHAEIGQDLADVAREWGKRVNVVPVFKGDYTYPVEAPLTFRGNFDEAITKFVKSFSTASPPPLIHHWMDEENNYAVQIILGNP